MPQFNLKAGLRIRIIRGTFSCRLESYLRNGGFVDQNSSILPAVGKTLAMTELMTSAVTKNETCCSLVAVGTCKEALAHPMESETFWSLLDLPSFPQKRLMR